MSAGSKAQTLVEKGNDSLVPWLRSVVTVTREICLVARWP